MITDSTENEDASTLNSIQPLVIGEVLFDCFPDGNAILGGAPFNVAWHLQGFGLSPLMISSVGNDKHGTRVLKLMQQWGMDDSGIQINPHYPTGAVTVSINNGQPSYEIRNDQAYDYIQYEQLQAVISKQASPQAGYNLLYHGSLITRSEHSRQLLDRLTESTGIKSFVDVNLRPPWWTRDNVQHFLQQATWVKLNEDELLTLMQVDNDNTDGLYEHAKQLQRQYALQMLVVTQGELGAFCVTEDNMISGSPVDVDVVDTVGAGDAFSAVVILGLFRHWPLAETLERALEFAARICEQRGATRVDRTLYERSLAHWLG